MPYEGLQLGHLKLINLIVSGGMREVYLSEDICIPHPLGLSLQRLVGDLILRVWQNAVD